MNVDQYIFDCLDRIEEFRDELGLACDECSEAMGYPRGKLGPKKCRYKAVIIDRKVKLTVNNLVALKDIYGCSIDYLLFGPISVDFLFSGLKDARDSKGFTQLHIANALDIKLHKIKKIESFEYKPNVEDLIKFSLFFDCSPRCFLT